LRAYINEKNVIKDEIYNNFENSVTCSICSDILIDPMMCMKCQNVNCKECIDDWKLKNDKCLNRCEEPNYQKCLAINELLSKLKFMCPNCDSAINYDDMKQHILISCKNARNIEKLDSSRLLTSKSINIITLGSLGVGKTTLIYKFENKNIKEPNLNLKHDSFNNIYTLSDGSIVSCFIYDINNDKKYDSSNDDYYKNANGCIIVYDITRKKSFEDVKKLYIPKIKEKCKKKYKNNIIRK